MSKLNLPPFYVGQKVVCIESKWIGEHPLIFIEEPLKDKTYTVNYIDYDEFYNIWFIGLTEMNQEDEFLSSCFAPLQEVPAPLLTFEQIKQTEKEEILILN